MSTTLLRQVQEVLEQKLDRESLQIAATRFWHAYFWVDFWPDTCQLEAREILLKFLRRGRIDVHQMSDEEVLELAQTLLAFCTRTHLLIQEFPPGNTPKIIPELRFLQHAG